MSWRDNLQPASFRGVPFSVDRAERSSGRKGTTHEFVGSDVVFHEDLGRAPRTFRLDAYVTGDDYMDRRNALLTALETPGPGVLVHPYYGSLFVALSAPAQVSEAVAEGGVARFTLEFIQTEDRPAQPSAVADTTGALVAAALTARAACGAAFVEQYIPGAGVSAVASALGNASAAINRAGAAVTSSVQEAATLRRRADVLITSATALAGAPQDLFSSLVSVLSGIPVGGFLAALGIYDFSPGPRPTATAPSRVTARANFDLTQQLVQRLAIICAAELILSEDFDTYEAAVEARESLASKLDEQAATAPDAAYEALMDLRSAVVSAVPGAESSLPRLRTVVLAESTPSVVVSYSLFGTLDQEADIVARNGVQHPGFVPGGVPLTVRTNG